MPITLTCSCGKVLRIADEHAGKRVKCPACQGVLSAPAATPPPAAPRSPSPQSRSPAAPAPIPTKPAFEVVEDEPPPLVRGPPVAKRRPDDDDEGEGEGEGYAVRKSERNADSPKPAPAFRKRADDDEDDEPRSRKKKKRPRRSRRSGGLPGAETGRRIGYIVGGAFGLFIGGVMVVWGNSEEESNVRLMIFGGIVAIGGLIGLVQGITGNLPDEDEE